MSKIILRGVKITMSRTLRSRIMEHFEAPSMKDIFKVCDNSVVSDNNEKVNMILNLLQQYKKDFIELGSGTNRLSILMDNYVFKIALDKWGMRDNANEFAMSHELQPYVIKTYETNDLIAVCEYVTLISREEFIERKPEIQKILAILAEGYLLGDVGTVPKNFCNWGYRDNGELVILDFAYIYRVRGDEVLCSSDGTILEYDENFYNLRCPKCNRKYSFMDVRRKIPMADEEKEVFMAKELSYKLTKPVQEVSEKDANEEEKSSLYNNTNTKRKEEPNMKIDNYPDRKEVEEEVMQEESYYDALNLFSGMNQPLKVNNDDTIVTDESLKKVEDVVRNINEECSQEITSNITEVIGDGVEDVKLVNVKVESITVENGEAVEHQVGESTYIIGMDLARGNLDIDEDENVENSGDKPANWQDVNCEEQATQTNLNEQQSGDVGKITVNVSQHTQQINSSLKIIKSDEGADCESQATVQTATCTKEENIDAVAEALRKELGEDDATLEGGDDYEHLYEENDRQKRGNRRERKEWR